MSTPYDDLIMDHIRNARNYQALQNADVRAPGMNPLCGDEVVVYVALEGERIVELAYQCTCCGISMASASIMTQALKEMTTREAATAASDVVAMLTSGDAASACPMTAERTALLETVRRFPARKGCAALPWTTLVSALENVHAAA
jgi:nitrogen fixation NifU-like protein